MKNFSIIVLLLLSISSCTLTQSHNDKPYSIYWEENNLCVEMPHPTMGIVTPGLANWRGVDLDNVVEDIYNECLKTHKSGDIVVWARFENPQTDKYGNETKAYDESEIVTIPLEEAKKYKSGKFLDAEYQIKQNFYNAAFGENQTYGNLRQTTLPDGTKVYLAPGDSLPTERFQPDDFVTPITNPADTANFEYIP
ncbi:hypothetical protein [uncultured Muribaculum sp.]|uniref:hypothetical protein n=1 Tax=uncultured Muribaculum sp. TaxID=1918613 RepID=UPI002731B738|nr:hypothetical protein [uncultured Muribaculum sp.]